MSQARLSGPRATYKDRVSRGNSASQTLITTEVLVHKEERLARNRWGNPRSVEATLPSRFHRDSRDQGWDRGKEGKRERTTPVRGGGVAQTAPVLLPHARVFHG